MVDFKAVDSSNVEAIGYEPGDRGKGTLHIRFKDGGHYAYDGVSPAHHKELIGAKSIGSHVYNHIVGKFPGRKVRDEDDEA